MARMWWKRKKLLTVLANRRQWEREFGVAVVIASAAYEIEMEHLNGYYLITESSSSAAPTYIITE